MCVHVFCVCACGVDGRLWCFGVFVFGLCDGLAGRFGPGFSVVGLSAWLWASGLSGMSADLS